MTWDDYHENELLQQNFQMATGKPFSQAGLMDRSAMIYLSKWLNKNMKKLINIHTYSQLTIIDTNFNSNPNHLVDLLLDIVDYV